MPEGIFFAKTYLPAGALVKVKLPVVESNVTDPEAPAGIETKLKGLVKYADWWYDTSGVYKLLSSLLESLPLTLSHLSLKLPSIKGMYVEDQPPEP